MSTAIVTISGWVSTDPTVRDTANSVVGSFSIATKRGYGDNEVTTWFKITGFGNFWADKIEKLNKGDIVIVTGEFSIEQYDTKGGTRTDPVVYLSFMRKLKNAEKRSASSSGRPERGRGRGRGRPQEDEGQVDPRIDLDDEIPF